MDELRDRFHRLDRMAVPDLWNEAVGRAAELDAAPRRGFNPGFVLIAAALLLASLAGTIAVGAWLDRADPVRGLMTYTNGLIVSHEGCGRITAYDPASLQAHELTPAVAGCTEDMYSKPPAWSTDGTRLAYLVRPIESDEASAGAWVYDTESGEARQVDACTESCHDITISPDGSLVAYVTLPETEPTADTRHSLVVVAVDTGARGEVEFASWPGNPVFSPDGARIALPLLGGRSGVHVVDVGAGEDGVIGPPTLVYGPVQANELAWSPDGEWIAMTQGGGLGNHAPPAAPFNGQIALSGYGIVIVRADGSDRRVLASASSAVMGGHPTWSADSTSLAFVAEEPDQQTALYTVHIDGGEPQRIYSSGESWGPAWSPDGEWIAFARLTENGDPTALVMVRPDGSDLQEVSAAIWDPVWQPIPEDE